MTPDDGVPEVVAEGPGFKVRAKGYRTVDLAWLLVAILVAGVGYMLREHSMKAEAAQIEQNTILRDIHITLRFIACTNLQPPESKLINQLDQNSSCSHQSRMR